MPAKFLKSTFEHDVLDVVNLVFGENIPFAQGG
jgi:hypothetical protein